MRYLKLMLLVILAGCDLVSPNQGPVLEGDLENVIVSVDDGLDLELVNYFRDPDGNQLTFQAESLDPYVIEVELNGSVLTLTVVEISRASVPINVTATDVDGESLTIGFQARNNILLYEDWALPESLDNWDIIPDWMPCIIVNDEPDCDYWGKVDTAFAEWNNGSLWMYPYSRVAPYILGISIEKDIEIEENWGITVEHQVASDNEFASLCVKIKAWTNHDYYRYVELIMDYKRSEWEFYVGVPHDYFGVVSELVGTKRQISPEWHFGSTRDESRTTLKHVDGIISVINNGRTYAEFDPTIFELLSPQEQDLPTWPPPDGQLPTEIRRIQVRNIPACGPYPRYESPRSWRSILVLDDVYVTEEVQR